MLSVGARCRVGLLVLLTTASAAAQDQLAKLKLPPGFQISIYAPDAPNARQLALAPGGTLFAGTRQDGRVFALVDRDGDGVAETQHVIARDLNMPSGVAFRDGALYVAEVHRILRYDEIENRLADPPKPVVVYADLPDARHHGWKFIGFSPSGELFIPVGAPCNICDPEPPFASILYLPAAGGPARVWARGVRNSVGFDWHPETGELWFGDNGRDWLGDDAPADELNHAPRAGLHFGYPHVHGGEQVDPELGAGHAAADFTSPALRLGAHVAPVGMEFYRGEQFPAAYRNALFVAEHGSWNRSRKSGYRVMVAHIDGDGRVTRYEPFITGWLAGEDHWGRPQDFATLPDGSLLISDDDRGVVYRVEYRAP